MLISILMSLSCGSGDVDITINGTPETTEVSQEPATTETEEPTTESFGNLLEKRQSFTGESPGDLSGYAIAGGGQLDTDTRADILIGAYGSDPNGTHSGKAYLVFGSSLSDDRTRSLSEADLMFVGEEPKDHLGMNLIFAPDLGNDGRSDIVIAAPYNKKIYIFHSDEIDTSDQYISVTEASYTLIGENAGDYIGWSMSVGDFDGDSKSDLLIGADGSDYGGFSAGLTYMILSRSLGTESRINMELSDYKFIGSYIGENSGQATATGDLDGDGLSDIIIGADGNDQYAENGGAIYVVYAQNLFALDLFLENADIGIFNNVAFAEAGSSLSSGQDATGDGVDDILVGAPSPEFHSSQKGRVY
ncbi:MAG: hypothetical protein VX278_05280, partial [Myxococcota bacterium]|nr:hypothetical protein [Myxococcota bacterium]